MTEKPITFIAPELEELIKETIYGDQAYDGINTIMEDIRGVYFESGHWVGGNDIAKGIIDAYELGQSYASIPAYGEDDDPDTMDDELADLIRQTVFGDDAVEQQRPMSTIMQDDRGANFEVGHWVGGNDIAKAMVRGYEMGRDCPDEDAVTYG